MSGVNYDGCEIRKGAADAMQAYVTQAGGTYSGECDQVLKSIATRGGTPLVVAKDHRILGVIYLKDIIKDGDILNISKKEYASSTFVIKSIFLMLKDDFVILPCLQK